VRLSLLSNTKVFPDHHIVWNNEADGIQMLEQADILDYDTDGNTTEITRSFYHRNALGSVMEITDINEAIVVSYRYDPYGSVTITRNGQAQTTDPLGQHWTFTGRYHEEEVNLYYYRARSYDPTTGRFLQRDPLGHAAGANLYEYARSNPTNRIDPWGLKDCVNESASEEECLKCCKDEYDKKKKDIETERDDALAEVDAWQDDMLDRLESGDLTEEELEMLDAYVIGTRMNCWLKNRWTDKYFPELGGYILDTAKGQVLNFGLGWMKAKLADKTVWEGLKAGARKAGKGAIQDAIILIARAQAGCDHMKRLFDSLGARIRKGDRRGAIFNIARDRRSDIRADARKKLKEAKKEWDACKKACRKKRWCE
jgi:RHS repeat-associated protein